MKNGGKGLRGSREMGKARKIDEREVRCAILQAYGQESVTIGGRWEDKEDREQNVCPTYNIKILKDQVLRTLYEYFT